MIDRERRRLERRALGCQADAERLRERLPRLPLIEAVKVQRWLLDVPCDLGGLSHAVGNEQQATTGLEERDRALACPVCGKDVTSAWVEQWPNAFVAFGTAAVGIGTNSVAIGRNAVAIGGLWWFENE